jgi:hypothetical protein
VLGLVTPDERGQRSLAFDQFLRALRIVDDRFDLAAMADDARVAEQSLDIPFSEFARPCGN